MPIYEYRCESCAYLWDALQKVGDPPLKECPECGASEVRRLVSAPSFRLKGGGWYETDFKSEKERKRNLAERRDTDGDNAKSEKSRDGEEKSAKHEKGHKEQRAEKKGKTEERKKRPGKGTDAVA